MLNTKKVGYWVVSLGTSPSLSLFINTLEISNEYFLILGVWEEKSQPQKPRTREKFPTHKIVTPRRP